MVGEYDMEKEWIDFIHSTSIVYERDSSGELVILRSVAQSGSASGLGPEGREFESLHSDQRDNERYYAYIQRRLREEDGKS